MTDEEMAATFSFLTVDDLSSDKTNSFQNRKRTDIISELHSNKVFVWGLNDIQQLGSGLTETKVSIILI